MTQTDGYVTYAADLKQLMLRTDHIKVYDGDKPIEYVNVVRCKDCKHNPQDAWLGCPMANLSEEQRPETAWCWKGERKDG